MSPLDHNPLWPTSGRRTAAVAAFVNNSASDGYDNGAKKVTQSVFSLASHGMDVIYYQLAGDMGLRRQPVVGNAGNGVLFERCEKKFKKVVDS